VTELRFHRELYDGKAIDEALKTFARFATFEQVEEPTHGIVRVATADASRERRIARELANFALGLTIKSGGAVGVAS
jgi:hypothetical protein